MSWILNYFWENKTNEHSQIISIDNQNYNYIKIIDCFDEDSEMNEITINYGENLIVNSIFNDESNKIYEEHNKTNIVFYKNFNKIYINKGIKIDKNFVELHFTFKNPVKKIKMICEL